MQCDPATNPNLSRGAREGSLFDTWKIASGGALADITLFNTNGATAGYNLCNLENNGCLGEGESFTVRSIMFECIGMNTADLKQIMSLFSFTLEIGGVKVVKNQVIGMYPQAGGDSSVAANGAQGYNTVKELARPIIISGTKTIRLNLKLGTGTPAAINAATLFVRVHLFGDDYTN